MPHEEIKTQPIDFERVKPSEIYRKKVKELKKDLPYSWRVVFLDRNPEYNNTAGIQLITRVVALKSTDVKVTELLEEIAIDYRERQNLEEE